MEIIYHCNHFKTTAKKKKIWNSTINYGYINVRNYNNIVLTLWSIEYYCTHTMLLSLIDVDNNDVPIIYM